MLTALFLDFDHTKMCKRRGSILQNSKQRREQYVLPLLNSFTTFMRIVWCILISGLIFVGIVSLLSGTVDQLVQACLWLVSTDDPQRILLLFTILVFLVLTILLGVTRWFLRDWIESFPEERREKYLLTWKKLREKQNSIIKMIWSILQVIWPGFILAVVVPIAIDLIEAKPQEVHKTPVGMFIDWMGSSQLSQQLVLYGIGTFVLLSLIVRIRARNLAREEDRASMKEWEPVAKSVDAALNVLQDLQALSQLTLKHVDERLVKDLTDKIIEPLQQQLYNQRNTHERLEDDVKKLKQQINDMFVSETPTVSLDKEITQKLNRFPKS